MQYRYKKAYSLLELSISLAIIATILSAGFSMINGNNNLNKKKDTERKMKIIEKSIASYASIYNRIPCPADLTLSEKDPNSGIENCCSGCSNFPSYSPTTLPASFSSSVSQTLTVGTIPYITLGLPKEYLADSWDNKFIYAATLGLAGSMGNSLENTNMGLITIKDISGGLRSDNAAYILMSAGNNGLGGYPRGYQILPAQSTPSAPSMPTNQDELTNYNNTIGHGNNFVANQQTNNFDDIVHYKQKWQIIKEAGSVISNQTCNLVTNLIEMPETLNNNINYSPLCSCGSSLNLPNTSQCSTFINQLDKNCSIFANNFITKIRELCIKQF